MRRVAHSRRVSPGVSPAEHQEGVLPDIRRHKASVLTRLFGHVTSNTPIAVRYATVTVGHSRKTEPSPSLRDRAQPEIKTQSGNRDRVRETPSVPSNHRPTVTVGTVRPPPRPSAVSETTADPMTAHRNTLRPTTPATTSSNEMIRGRLRDSCRKSIPTRAVPAAPMPTQTAYAVPTGSDRRA